MGFAIGVFLVLAVVCLLLTVTGYKQFGENDQIKDDELGWW